MHKPWDWTLFLSILAIGTLSILSILSIDSEVAISQIIFWAIGLFAFYLTWHFNYRHLSGYSVIIYLLSLLALLLVLILAEPIRGSVRWFTLGPIRIQPSEIAKIASILLLANFFSHRSSAQLKNIVLSLAIIIPAIFLVGIEPDIGNALIFPVIWFGMVLVAGIKLKQVLALVFISFFTLLILFQFLAPYQKERINTFLSPTQDSLGTGYHIIQSKIAIGSGKIVGNGLGLGTQSHLNFLPEAESDFIFATLSEQLGFIGAGLLIILYVVILSKLLNYTGNTDKFGKLILIGTFTLVISQFSINIGMNMGLLPVTGITLPFMSAGGSSLVTLLALFGIVFSIIYQKY